MIQLPTEDQFDGFFPETIDFLRGLQQNNNKTWFEVHRAIYRNYLLIPMQKLVMELGDFMATIDPGFDTVPAIDHTISRIYRDTRFSKDKSPYRPNMWIAFKRPFTEWKGLPTFYFEIYPDYYHFGMGYYVANRATMDAFRSAIVTQPAEFRKVVRAWEKTKLFKVEGDKYKRPPLTDLPSDLARWYQWKSFYLVCQRQINLSGSRGVDRSAIFSHDLVDELMLGFGSTADFYHFLQKLNT